jgi:Bacterial Ig-like domain (group 1)
MHKFFSIAALAAVTMLMGGCGGGSAFDGGTGPVTTSVASIAVTSDTASIPSDGSSGAAITVVAKDANNAAVSGAVITFNASNGGTVTATQGTTDTTGTAKATLAVGTATAGASIVVTASTGSASGQATVTVANTQRTLTLQTDMPQIPSNNAKGATITALVRDASNNFLPNINVIFTADSGGVAVTQGTTDSTGAAKAVLSTPNDPSNRNITVTATVGSTSKTIVIPVVGTTLSVTGPQSLVLGSSGTYSIALTDSAGTGIPGTAVTVTSTVGTVSAATVTTDATGHGTFQVTGATAGNDNVTVSALGITSQQAVGVSGQNFVFSTPADGTSVNLGTAQTLTVHWTSNGAVQTGQAVNFAATRGTLSAATAVTDGAGNATVTIQSTTSGPSVISASASGVQATLNLDFKATNPTAIEVQASPATIPVQGQSTISAIVRDAANNLVEGQTVNFALTDITGGSLTVASATTDVQGRAQTVYKAASTPSASNGVKVTATVQGTAVTNSTNLTVGGQTVFLSLGTGVNISENSNLTQFIMPWSVSAIDAAGNPVNNIIITLTLHSKDYEKGKWKQGASAWIWDYATATGLVTIAYPGCPNEDANLNGVLDPGEDTSGNGNNNGKLDPGDIALATPGTVTTGTDGSALFNVQYPEDHAFWVRSTLTATATVQGTETSTSATFQLPMLAKYVNDVTKDIPGRISPYGVGVSCTDPN